MGCAKKIWNAKCEENRYYTAFARKYAPIGTYAPVDQTTAQFKDRELTPYLYDCPSQILRNSATNWYQTYQKFMRGTCGKPKIKKKSERGSIHFHFRQINKRIIQKKIPIFQKTAARISGLVIACC